MVHQRIRTLLIDDSAFMRKVIGDMLRSDDAIDLLGIANDGRAGTEMAMELKPDVIITDMVMPEFDGMYVVKEVMENRPVPIILLSSLEKSNSRIFDALQSGAFEFIDKPSDLDVVKKGAYPLIDLVKEASVTDITLLKAKQLARKNTHAHTFTSALNYDIIVVGASTGGPGALEFIINNLPHNLQLPVVIAQHMPSRFLETFSSRLNERSPLPVKLVHRGEALRGGAIYIASGEFNTKIELNIMSGQAIFSSTGKKYDEFNCPSIDCLFESVAHLYKNRCIGVILTGMGKDGMRGLKMIKDAGGFTLAQDEHSSVVYGMPKAAFEYGAVRQVVKLTEMPGFIVSCL